MSCSCYCWPRTQLLPQHRTSNKSKSLFWLSCCRRKNRVLVVAAAAGSGASASSSQYSEPLFGVEKKQKKRSIAGIDQDELVDPSKLADSDSCFLEFQGVQIHHKICEHHEDKTSTPSTHLVPHQATRIAFPFILLHGFGASLYSWTRAMKPLARATSSKVVAFDRPAFGLTSRSSSSDKNTKSLNPYSMAFSVLATLTFIDFLAADKAILIGHSAGSLVAVNTYFEAPERVAALILVAPAIFAPRAPSKEMQENQRQREKHDEANEPTSKAQWNPLIMIGHMFSKLSMYIVQPILSIWNGMVNMVSSIYRKALTAFLRSTFAAMLLRMVIDKFGIAGIKNAWYDATQVTEHVLNDYTKPLKIKNWDRALLEYTVALLTDTVTGPPLSKRLKDISCPVLIITGDSDRLTPSWNAERLSQAIPGSSLEVIKNCGHLPQEEKVEEFVSSVQKFLQRVFGAQEEKLLQPAS